MTVRTSPPVSSTTRTNGNAPLWVPRLQRPGDTSKLFLLYLSSLFFVAAGVIGTRPMWWLIKQKHARMKVVYLHGAVALLGLMLLMVGVTDAEGVLPYVIAFGFVLTAMGGMALFALRRARAQIPTALALLHPALAVLSFVLLFIYMTR